MRIARKRKGDICTVSIYIQIVHTHVHIQGVNESQQSAHRIFEELFIRISSSPPPLLQRLREVEKLAEERLQQVKKMDGGEVEGRRRRRRSE